MVSEFEFVRYPFSGSLFEQELFLSPEPIFRWDETTHSPTEDVFFFHRGDLWTPSSDPKNLDGTSSQVIYNHFSESGPPVRFCWTSRAVCRQRCDLGIPQGP